MFDININLPPKDQKENERTLIEEINIYKDILYTLDYRSSDIEYLEKVIADRINNSEKLLAVNVTTSIKKFIENLIKDKKKLIE